MSDSAAEPQLSLDPVRSRPEGALGRAARIVGYVSGLALGLVLLVAAWAKALDPTSFADQIQREGLAILLTAPAMALLALALEVGIGVALVLGVRRLYVLIPALLLVGLFVFLTGRAYLRFLHGEVAADGCGCFGNLVDRTPAEAFWQDLAMLVPALGLAFLGRRKGALPKARTAVAAVAAMGAAAFAWRAPDLPLDDLATRLKPGVELATICAGREPDRVCLDRAVPEIASGEHTIVLADLDDLKFGESVAALNAIADREGARPLWVLTASSPESKTRFFWQYGPSFEIREVPSGILRPLYRRLPRSFEVREGRVTETYRALPPNLERESPASSPVAARESSVIHRLGKG